MKHGLDRRVPKVDNFRSMRIRSAFSFLLVSLFSSGAFAQQVGAPAPVNSISVPSWTLFAELAASQNENASNFGQSISVSGNVAVVGSTGDSGATGAAYVFVKPSKGIANVAQRARLTASDGQPGSLFGYSVSISGNAIVVGAPGAFDTNGKAYIFVEPPGGWVDMTETAQLTASDGQSNDDFGLSASIYGNTVVIGAANHQVGSNTQQGAAYVFVEPQGGWTSMTQTAELTASDGVAGSFFGLSVAMNGNTVISGAPNVGEVYVFVEPLGGWINMTQTAELTDSDDVGIGYSVAISGNTVVTGSPFTGSIGRGPTGAADVYIRPGNTWKTTNKPAARLGASDGDAGDRFGFSIASTGSTIIAGAPYAHCLGVGCQRGIGDGIAYAFAEPANGWTSMTQTQELTPSDGVSQGSFGQSVAANGPAVLVGADGTNTAYVYQYHAK